MYNKKSKIELKKSLKRESFNRTTCSFYKYCFIDNPEDLRNKLYSDLIEQDILGRIYVSKEGINAQISIPEHNVEDFKSYIQSFDVFNDIKFKHAVEEGTSFLKLKILVRDEIVACEKASSYLIKKGFKEVYQLEGGIIQYAHDMKENDLKSEFIGKNFVFDDRMGERVTNDIIGKCHQCKTPSDDHKNCKNDACHLLFIQCDKCAEKYNDCCSNACNEFLQLDIETQKKLRKDKNKKVSSAKLSTKFRPKLYKLFNYWK